MAKGSQGLKELSLLDTGSFGSEVFSPDPGQSQGATGESGDTRVPNPLTETFSSPFVSGTEWHTGARAIGWPAHPSLGSLIGQLPPPPRALTAGGRGLAKWSLRQCQAIRCPRSKLGRGAFPSGIPFCPLDTSTRQGLSLRCNLSVLPERKNPELASLPTLHWASGFPRGLWRPSTETSMCFKR